MFAYICIMKKIGVLVVNLGTPNSPKTSDVRTYLLQFLLDKRVIDIPFILRQALVRLIIAPFRAPKSAKTYRAIWSDTTGSPLKFHTQNASDLLQKQLPENYKVVMAMRYQNPSIEIGLETLRKSLVEEIIVLPMFPHYASASTGSVHEEVMRIISGWQAIPNLRFITDYYDHPLFIKAILDKAAKFDLNEYDHILFSYHGLPERHMRKQDITKNHCQKSSNCCETLCETNRFCYSAQCRVTTKKLVEVLQIPQDKYTTCFQSRLGNDPWVKPYTIEVLKKLSKEGVKKILCFSPAFTADCLETVFEISEEYNEDFIEMGGESVTLVPSLNDSPLWIECMQSLVMQPNT
jgi:ferrochelatase